MNIIPTGHNCHLLKHTLECFCKPGDRQTHTYINRGYFVINKGGLLLKFVTIVLNTIPKHNLFFRLLYSVI